MDTKNKRTRTDMNSTITEEPQQAIRHMGIGRVSMAWLDRENFTRRVLSFHADHPSITTYKALMDKMFKVGFKLRDPPSSFRVFHEYLRAEIEHPEKVSTIFFSWKLRSDYATRFTSGGPGPTASSF
jgi:hypothetical protein